MQQVLPIYLAVDASASMGATGRLGAVEHAVLRLTDELLASPVLGEMIRVGIVAFSDHAELILPLSDLTELSKIPAIQPRNGTSFTALFRHLARQLERDLWALKSHDVLVHRPIVIVFTDGQPTESGWLVAYRMFKDVVSHRIFVFGLNQGDEAAEIFRRLEPQQYVNLKTSVESRLPDLVTSALVNIPVAVTGSMVVSSWRHRQPQRQYPPEVTSDDPEDHS